MRMRDYTQANHDCKRSGVGQTKGDWSKLTRWISADLQSSQELKNVQSAFGTSSTNAIDYAAKFATNDNNDGGLGSRGPKMTRR